MIVKYSSNSRYLLSANNKEADRKPFPGAVVYSTYVAKEGETLDGIAYKLLRDFSRYWEIADINPHIKFPTRLSAGTVIRIPR